MIEEGYGSHEMISKTLIPVMLIVLCYPQNIVTSNCNNNSNQLYYICKPYKMTERRYGLYQMVSKAFILVIAFSITKVATSKIKSNLI